jgi:hypothetical protein
MPFWYALTLLLTAALVVADWHRTGSWPLSIVISTALWTLSIVYTIAALVPINDKIAAWTPETRPANWKTFRFRWDKLHQWRVVLLSAACSAGEQCSVSQTGGRFALDVVLLSNCCEDVSVQRVEDSLCDADAVVW